MGKSKMKIFNLIVFFILISLGLNAQNIYQSPNRQTISLNGYWNYILDVYQTGNIGFMPLYKNIKQNSKTDRVEYNFDKSDSLIVPGSWNYQKTELYYYESSIWYRKTFSINQLDQDSRYFLRISSANYISKVTINGQVLGEHEGGFTPFSFEITNNLKNGENFVIIGVNSSRRDDGIPCKVTDWFNHGGITGDVQIIKVPKNFISHFFINLDKNSLNKKVKTISGKVFVEGNANQILLQIKELGIKQIINKNADGEFTFSFSCKNLVLWSDVNPKLYEVEISLDNDKIIDKVGFRVIETIGNKIYLNGKSIFLKGISVHNENPMRKDRSNSIDDALLVINSAKELGCNFLRLAHYPHQENLLKLADEKGILLWEELPLYWGIQWNNPKVLHKAKAQYQELINRDYNRASSIIWSIANETAPMPDRNNFLGSLADFIRQVDSTRLISAACKKDQELDGHPDKEYTYNDPLINKLDIISFNEYLGWYGDLPSACRTKTFSSSFNKPMIVSEFGGGAKAGFHADSLTRWSEEYQEYLYKEGIAMFDKIDAFCGFTPWILFDFMSPLRQLPDVQDGWNRKGLISSDGRKKKAFFVLRDYYQKK